MNHSVIEHRANYHFAKIEEDYLAICSTGKTSPHCKALILSILECWTNTKRDRDEGEYVFMTIPQWIKYTYMLYERNMITECMRELMQDGLIERRGITMYNQDTFEYKLCIEQVQSAIKALPEKNAKDTLPNLTAYTTYRDAVKEKHRAAREEKKVREKSPTHSDSDKSQGVGDNSPTVGEKSTKGYVKNQRNLESITKLPLTSNQERESTHTSEPDVQTFVAERNAPSLSSSSEDEQATRDVVEYMLSQQSNPASVFYMPPQISPNPGGVEQDGGNTHAEHPIATSSTQPTQEQREQEDAKPTKPTRNVAPKPPKDTTLAARIEKVFQCLDRCAQEHTGEATFTWTRSGRAKKAVKELLESGKTVTEERMEKVYKRMATMKPTAKGFTWADKMSVKNVCEQFDSIWLEILGEQKPPTLTEVPKPTKLEHQVYKPESNRPLSVYVPEKNKKRVGVR